MEIRISNILIPITFLFLIFVFGCANNSETKKYKIGFSQCISIFGILLPFLISLLFRKERRGRVFNNNAAIISYVVWLTAMNY